mgnify:CR=1 FL=1
MTKMFCDICGEEIQPYGYNKEGTYCTDTQFNFTLKPVMAGLYCDKYENADICKECAYKILGLIDELQMKN